MIGTDHNLTLPSTSETMAVNIARIATAFETLEDSIAERATPAALNINAPLDMQGNSLTDVASVVFTSGNQSETVGSIYYYNGDWYVVDAVGTIQLTDAGQLNAASIGGIGGDYGGVNPAAVTYVDSDGQYVFTEDTGVYADLRADDLILEGTNGRVTINVHDDITGDRNINIKTLVNSDSAICVYNSADESFETTNTIPTPTAADYKFTTARTRWIPFLSWFSPGSIHTVSDYWSLTNAATNELQIPIRVETGERITGWNVFFTKGTAANEIQATLYSVNAAGTRAAVGGTDTDNTTLGAGSLSVSGLTEDVGAYASYYLVVRRTAASTGSVLIKTANITVTRP